MELATRILILTPCPPGTSVGAAPRPDLHLFRLLARVPTGSLHSRARLLGLLLRTQVPNFYVPPRSSHCHPPDRHSPRDYFTRLTQTTCVCCEVLCMINQSRFRGGGVHPSYGTHGPWEDQSRDSTTRISRLFSNQQTTLHCGQRDV